MQTKTKLLIGLVVVGFTATTVFLYQKHKKSVKESAHEKPQEAADEVLGSVDISINEDYLKVADDVLEGVKSFIECMKPEDIMIERELKKMEDELLDENGEEYYYISPDEELKEAEETAEDDEETDDKELEELRYDPYSKEAQDQYENMLLADVISDESRFVLHKLFGYQFMVSDESTLDWNIYEDCKDARKAFFGIDGGWPVENVTVAELFLVAAGWLDYDLNGGVDKWVGKLLDNCGLKEFTGEATFDTIVNNVLDHQLYARKGYGMFALHESDGDGYAAKSYREQYNSSPYLDGKE